MTDGYPVTASAAAQLAVRTGLHTAECEQRGGSELQFAGRGEHELRGVPERWQLFALER
jgi:hypothetical protein